MPGVFIGSTELTTVGDIKIGGTDVQEVYVGATKIFPSGAPALPELVVWNPEIGEALLPTMTFIRGTTAYYRNDSGLWVLAAAGENRYHNAIPGGGGKGYLPETSATNVALHRRDFTNAVWVASNITPAKDATGIDGVASAASTLTATAANGTILQSFTRASSSHTFSVFVARKTGTGTIEITIDGGSTWVDITGSLTNDITNNPFKVTQTLQDPSIGFRIVTSGDEVEVDIAQLEATNYGTTPIDDAASPASSVSRSADSLTDSTLLTAQHSAVLDVTCPAVLANNCLLGFNGAERVPFPGGNNLQYNNNSISMTVIGGTPYLEERHQFAFSVEENNAIILDDEGSSAPDMAGIPNSGQTIKIGMRGTGIQQFNGVMHHVEIWSVPQTQEELEARIGL